MKTNTGDNPKHVRCPHCESVAVLDVVDRQVKYFCTGCPYAFSLEWHFKKKPKMDDDLRMGIQQLGMKQKQEEEAKKIGLFN